MTSTSHPRRTWFAILSLLAALGCSQGDATGGDDDSGLSDDDDSAVAGDDDDDTADGTCDGDPQPGAIGTDPECAELQPYELFVPEQTVRWQWTGSAISPDHQQVVSTPIVIQLTDDNGDGVIDDQDTPDVVFPSQPYDDYINGVLRALSGVDGSELWSTDGDDLHVNSNGTLAAADLLPGHDGPEIVVLTQDAEVACFDRLGNEIWRTYPDVNLYGAAPAIHDMDGDGSPEVIAGRAILSAEGDILGIGEYGEGSNLDRGPRSFAVDIDDDGELEVITGNAVYDRHGNTEWYNGELDGYPAVADFDLDGDPEIVVVSDGGVRLQDHEGTVIWGPTDVPGNGRGGPPTVADFDGDGLPEIGSANNNYYSVVDDDGALLWSQPTFETSSGATGSSVFDFNGDGTAEVVYADESYLYIFEGPDGTVLLQEGDHANRTQYEYPVIVDLDGDHHAEIVLASCDDFEEGWAGVTVLGNLGEQGWWMARPIWNQHAFFFDNINADGTVPTQQGKPWLTHNSLRQNFPATNWAGFPLPDLIARPTGPCEDGGGQTHFGVRVGNQGAAGISPGVQVSVYTLAGGDRTLLGTDYLADGVEAGVLAPAVYLPYDEALAGEVFEVVVDDPDQDGDRVYECVEDNNGTQWP